MTVTRVGARLEDALRRYASEPALRVGSDACTYGDIERASAALRSQLEPFRNAPVCLEGTASVETIVALVACARTGTSVLVPPPNLPDPIRRRVLEAAGCRVVLSCDRADPGRVTEVSVLDEVANQNRPRSDDPEVTVDDDCVLFTTSGSTGTPKVVPIEGAAVDRFADWVDRQFGLGPGRRVLSYAPLHFDLSLLEVWSPLLTGAEVVMVESTVRTDADRLAELVQSSKVHIVEGVPFVHHLLVASGQRFEGVDWVVTTGEAMAAPLAALLPTTFPTARFANVYGSTETNDSHLAELGPAELETGRLPIGRPLPGVAILIDDRVVPEGRQVEGLLSVATPFQANRVIGSRAADRFLQHDGRTYCRTGDRVRHDSDGTLHLLGRDDHLVKVRGTQVSIEAVEATIGAHPLVVECGVCATEDAGSEPQLVAHVRMVSDEADGSTVAIRNWCAENLAPPSIPRRFQLWTTPLPRGASGKLDRRALVSTLPKPPLGWTSVSTDPRALVTAHLIHDHLNGESIGSIPGDLDLFASGVLDSLSALVLVTWIEATFQMTVEDDHVVDRVRTLDAIIDHIEQGGVRVTMTEAPHRPSTDLEEFLS